MLAEPLSSLDSSRELSTASTHPSFGPARPELRREMVYYFFGGAWIQTIGDLGQILLDSLQGFLGTYLDPNSLLPSSFVPLDRGAGAERPGGGGGGGEL